MGNSTTFLTMPAAQTLGTQIVHIEREIDFTVENLASGSTMDVLKLPKGCVPLQAGIITKTINTGTTGSKVALGLGTATLAIVAATELGAANSVVITPLTASVVLAAEDTLRMTGSVSDMTLAKIVVFMDYVVSDACRN